MTLVIKRILLAAVGGLLGALLVALVEARAACSPGGPGYTALVVADFGVLAPTCALIALALGAGLCWLEPGPPQSPSAHLTALRTQPVLARTRTAALAPLAVLVSFWVVVALANVARGRLATGAPAEAGALLAIDGAALMALGASVLLALLSPLRRVLATGYERRPWLLDPARTGGAALVLAAGCLAWGVRAGDVGGDGAWPLGVFGVLKRAELDLRPVVDVLAVAACAYLAPVALAQRATARVALVSAVCFLGAGLATARTAQAMNDSASLTRGIERSAPLGRVGLHLARRATDRDKDGSSPYFGGGDCDDRNPLRSPFTLDVPGNGIDEDCSGADTPKPVPVPVPVPVLEPETPPDLNVLLITIDTLRPDVGFMGYEKPTTPNLDALASKATVFDHAYSLASYTGKSIGPLMIGKYPSETQRDGGHFNKYAPTNVFLAERLHDAGIHTMGAASHWYFAAWSGLSQGMDTWDLSAKPSEGQGDNDTSVTSAQLSDAALRLLQNHDNTNRRFFAWLHYFDPHEQYMPHEGAPNFVAPGSNFAGVVRGQYDAEVWFTDKQIGRVLDYVATQPWAEKTAIVVTSDHGEAFGEHDMSWHGVELWEPLVHVPLVVYLPGAKPHHVSEKRSHIDLVPTILDVMHVPVKPGDLEGRSLVADVLGPSPYDERDVYIDMPIGPYTLMRKAMITGKTPGTKLIYSGGKSYQLFDLLTDPDEAHDLSGDPNAMGPVLEAFDRTRANLHEIDVPPEAP